MTEVTLVPLTDEGREEFIPDNQEAFNHDHRMAKRFFAFRHHIIIITARWRNSACATIIYAAWCAVGKLHSEVAAWETVTPCFEKRNIHFYVNRCGFHIVEFFDSHHPDPNDPESAEDIDGQFPEGMFRFEKKMR